ncbi:ubiquinol-cytochrome c reductase iron-sulfur subunit [Nodosilinea nodulosa]|uniref:QcrA and Rieske domain-containing protein n=1 Tax=Nodosilinea nodulosa TaxID=416001 RepID=UPI0002F1176E|nr:Rieske (2Fe-2S) protein [Nodosilinea nodulosa]
MDRRIFLQWIGLGSVAGLLPSCLGRLRAANGATGGAAGAAPLTAQASAYTPVGTVSQLNQAGVIVNNHTPLGAVTVVRDQANQLRAVSPICPHQGCRVDWQANRSEFHCPCHGARFAAGGKVLTGPARSDLPAFSTRVENGNVLVARVGNSASGQIPGQTSDQATEARYPLEADDELERGEHEGNDDRGERHSKGQSTEVSA